MEVCEWHGSAKAAKPRGTSRPVREQPFQSMLSTTFFFFFWETETEFSLNKVIIGTEQKTP